MKAIKFCLLLVYLSCCLIGCGKLNARNSINGDYPLGIRFDRLESSLNSQNNNNNSKLSETATPKLIEELGKNLEQLSPQVAILTPQVNEVFNNTSIRVKLKVENLSLFKDDKLKMGPHLDLILDNEPSRKIYNLDEPVVLENLTPGTHTLRVFAARPWDESFKNEEAYAQTSFSVLTKTEDNHPDPNLPLLTYSNPTGTYGAEPIMLDFYLTNAPLHIVAKENYDDDIKDWKIKITINGESFVTESWQPIYLTGLERGKNWIKLELVDEDGNSIENVFNDTVRVITYDTQEQDTLAKLVTGKMSITEARSIVEQHYYVQPVGTPEIIESESESKNIKPEVITEKSLSSSDSKIDNNSTIENDSVVKLPTSELTAPEETEIKIDDADKQETPKLEKNITTVKEIELPKKEIQERIISTEEKPIKSIKIEAKNTLDKEPIATIEIPESESLRVTGKEIIIETPTAEQEPKSKTEMPNWLRNILSTLRHKLENLARLLPE
jgi:hypothetical protein